MNAQSAARIADPLQSRPEGAERPGLHKYILAGRKHPEADLFDGYLSGSFHCFFFLSALDGSIHL